MSERSQKQTIRRRVTTRDHHPECSGGCGQLADECTCRHPNPLGSMTIRQADSTMDCWPGVDQ